MEASDLGLVVLGVVKVGQRNTARGTEVTIYSIHMLLQSALQASHVCILLQVSVSVLCVETRESFFIKLAVPVALTGSVRHDASMFA